jgi:hypothetical protein
LKTGFHQLIYLPQKGALAIIPKFRSPEQLLCCFHNRQQEKASRSQIELFDEPGILRTTEIIGLGRLPHGVPTVFRTRRATFGVNKDAITLLFAAVPNKSSIKVKQDNKEIRKADFHPSLPKKASPSAKYFWSARKGPVKRTPKIRASTHQFPPTV